MNDHANQLAKDIQTILDADHEARLAAAGVIQKLEKAAV